MRAFNKGKLVGEQEPPLDFGQWLRGEIAQAAQIKPDVRAAASVHARRAALQEVLAAWNDSRRSV